MTSSASRAASTTDRRLSANAIVPSPSGTTRSRAINERLTVSVIASTVAVGRPASHSTPTVGNAAAPSHAATTDSSAGDHLLGGSGSAAVDVADAHVATSGDHIAMSSPFLFTAA